ncbi:MAG: S1 RNA-binding domain-containing protein [Chloroflexi bacterium]|nr:S1 RNA-binding domain-containing protein [Chloroflexota bacterium]
MIEESSQATQPTSIGELKPKMKLQGVVKDTQLYGAIVDIGLDQDGLVHISQLARSRTNRVTDVVSAGETVTVWVTRIDAGQGRIGLTMVEPPDVDWNDLSEGQTCTGSVIRIESYGAFVDIGAERPGLLHVREMSSGYVRHPSEIVKEGDVVEVRILSVDRKKRRIDLTMKGVGPEVSLTDEAEDDEPLPTAIEMALQRARADKNAESRGRRSKRKSADLAEREAILSRTLRQHSR